MSLGSSPRENRADTNPHGLQVIRRNGQIVDFNIQKIEVAITKAFVDVEGMQISGSESLDQSVRQVSQAVLKRLHEQFKHINKVSIEAVQDTVELYLWKFDHERVARAYVIYRNEHEKLRQQKKSSVSANTRFYVTSPGQRVPYDEAVLLARVQQACGDLKSVDCQKIAQEAYRNLYDQVPEKELENALVLSARSMVETNLDYGLAASFLCQDALFSEVSRTLRIQVESANDFAAHEQSYRMCFKQAISFGVQIGQLDKQLLSTFDLEKLALTIQPERDQLLQYLGMQTLYDRYLLRSPSQERFELVQTFFMRVAMGLALREDNPTERAIEFYHLLSSLDYMCSTPTLFNAGCQRPQLSSCFLTTIPDDLAGIYGSIQDNAMLSKYSGGIGNDWTPVRSMGALIKGTNGPSQGIVPFLNVVDATAIAVNQGGKRKGAVVAYLETWHLDIEAFLELRKNTGDDRRRTHDMNTAHWIPDLFMERVHAKGGWTLFSPEQVPDLHDTYGEQFRNLYETYEKQAKQGKIRSKTINAVDLWRKMLGMVFETGHPWLTFKDACNLRSPQQHAGVVHSSNLCTEITLNTSAEEIAVCNLGSINLPQHTTESGLDVEHLKRTIKTAVRMLDNVIDVNFYTVPTARASNLKHRPVALGLMGFQDALYKQKLSYASQAAVDFADQSMELISYHAIEASMELAKSRGCYESFEGSLWSQGVLPIDSIKNLEKSRSGTLKQDQTIQLDWSHLRKSIMQFGMRNSNVMAIAPTATIANICGVSQSIEPTYQNLFVKSNMSGEFTVLNPYLVADLKALDLWDSAMVHDLKYHDGSVSAISRIPEDIRQRYATAFEIDPKWFVLSASRRQKWIDQAQSLNLYMAEPSGKKLDRLYKMAWEFGLKTTYYLRSMGKTHAEKSTVHDQALNAVQSAPDPKVCQIDDPDCEACQ